MKQKNPNADIYVHCSDINAIGGVAFMTFKCNKTQRVKLAAGLNAEYDKSKGIFMAYTRRCVAALPVQRGKTVKVQRCQDGLRVDLVK